MTYRPVDSLVPDPRNARTHPKRQLDQIMASIREFGLGTTLIAAERADRRFRGIDIDPACVDVAIERWKTMTGEEPRLDHGAQT